MDVAGGWKGKKERTSPLPVYLRSRRPRVHFQRSVWQTGRKKKKRQDLLKRSPMSEVLSRLKRFRMRGGVKERGRRRKRGRMKLRSSLLIFSDL